MSKIAIVHDWFTRIAGSEKVVKEIKHCFPNADVFSLVDHLSDNERESLGIDAPIRTSFINRLPIQSKFRHYLPLMPIAIEQLDLREYDLVFSSSHAVAKGCLTTSEQLHISYVHTPMRYAWDMYHEYLEQKRMGWGLGSVFARSVLHYLRNWDRATADRPDFYIANSKYVRERIRKTYRRDSTVIYPPVDVNSMPFSMQKQDYFLAAGRLVPYKRFDLIVDAMKELPNEKLVLIGDGPEMSKIQSLAGPNVEVLGYQNDEVLREHMKNAKAFVFAAVEDFGIMPVEAQACGTPVIGLNRGGVAETVIPMQTGVLFSEQTSESIVEAIRVFLELPSSVLDSDVIRAHTQKFCQNSFRNNLLRFVESAVHSRGGNIEEIDQGWGSPECLSATNEPANFCQ
ncbi:MAG: glycosyltransferase [Planctomycetota bacterium]